MRVLLLLKIIVIFLLPKFAFAKVTEVTLLFNFPFVNLVFANCFFASGANWVKDSEIHVSNNESISQNADYTVIGDRFAFADNRLKGSVKVYDHHNNFSLYQVLIIPPNDEFKSVWNFGKSVAIGHNNIILVAADTSMILKSCGVFIYVYEDKLKKWEYSKFIEAPKPQVSSSSKSSCTDFGTVIAMDSLGRNSILGFPDYNSQSYDFFIPGNGNLSGAVIISNLSPNFYETNLQSYFIEAPFLKGIEIKNFGRAVHLDGNFAVISAHSENFKKEDFADSEGMYLCLAIIYSFSDDEKWEFKQVLKFPMLNKLPLENHKCDFLQSGLSLNKDILAVGYPMSLYEDSSLSHFEGRGLVYLYHRDKNDFWTLDNYLLPPDSIKNVRHKNFGNSIAMTSNYLVISDPLARILTQSELENSTFQDQLQGSGVVYIYKKSSDDAISKNWILDEALALPKERLDLICFGKDVKISGEQVFVPSFLGELFLFTRKSPYGPQFTVDLGYDLKSRHITQDEELSYANLANNLQSASVKVSHLFKNLIPQELKTCMKDDDRSFSRLHEEEKIIYIEIFDCKHETSFQKVNETIPGVYFDFSFSKKDFPYEISNSHVPFLNSLELW